MDGASNLRGSGAGIVLEGPEGVLIEQSLRFAFKASNNKAEYEALIAGMLLAKEMGNTRLLVKSDSALVAGQVTGEFKLVIRSWPSTWRSSNLLRRILFSLNWCMFQGNKIAEPICYPSWLVVRDRGSISR